MLQSGWLRAHGLSLTLAVLFLTTMVGQIQFVRETLKLSDRANSGVANVRPVGLLEW